MTKKYLEEFRESCKVSRGSEAFAIKMNDEMELVLSKEIELDPDCDPPAPDWIMDIVTATSLSKRVKMHLICFHNKQIKERRMRKAKGL